MIATVWYGSEPHHAAEQETFIERDGRWRGEDLPNTNGVSGNCRGNPATKPQVLGREFALQNNFIVRMRPAVCTFLLHEGGVE